ncbi:hypothetical protein [Marinilactibacillus psychrotolerans]|uniref:hypothetical protein n=1 Tax=Marinilactibacillus psychrotolerans TaxID=191770 RepID=UPI00382BA4E8
MNYDYEIYGTLADWIGILVTVATIFLTIRHYSASNKIDFRIMSYSRNKSKEKKGITYINAEREFIVTGVNFGQNPELFRLEGFLKREKIPEKIKRIILFKKREILPVKIDIINHKKIEYQLVQAHHQIDEEVFDINYLKNHLEINNFDVNKGFYIIYAHVSGKKFKKRIKIAKKV